MTFKIHPKIKRSFNLMRDNNLSIYRLHFTPIQYLFILMGLKPIPPLFWSLKKLLFISISFLFLINLFSFIFFNEKQTIQSTVIELLTTFLVCIFIHKNEVLPIRKLIGKTKWEEV